MQPSLTVCALLPCALRVVQGYDLPEETAGSSGGSGGGSSGSIDFGDGGGGGIDFGDADAGGGIDFGDDAGGGGGIDFGDDASGGIDFGDDGGGGIDFGDDTGGKSCRARTSTSTHYSMMQAVRPAPSPAPVHTHARTHYEGLDAHNHAHTVLPRFPCLVSGGIDFGDDDAGGGIDFGDDAGGGIDFGDDSGGIDFGDDSGGISVGGGADIGIVVESTGSTQPPVTTRESILQLSETRNQVIDQLLELEGFLVQRHTELSTDESLTGQTQFQNAPATVVPSTTVIEGMITAVQDVVGLLTKPKVQQLILITNSVKYLERLTVSLTNKQQMSTNLLGKLDTIEEQRVAARQTIAETTPKLKAVVSQTKIIQGQVNHNNRYCQVV